MVFHFEMSLLRIMSFFCSLYIRAGASLLSVLSMHLVASCSHGDFIVVLIALAFRAGGKRPRFAQAKASHIARFRKHHMLKFITLVEPAHIFFPELSCSQSNFFVQNGVLFHWIGFNSHKRFTHPFHIFFTNARGA